MIREATIGTVLALVLFLVWLGWGWEMLPFIVFGLMALILLFFVENRGGGFSPRDCSDKTNSRNTISFDQIGGQNRAKNEIIEALNFMINKEETKVLGIRPLKGVLLSGAPGTGKTLLAKAAAGYTDSVFLTVSGSEFIEMYAGVGAKRIRQMFRQAYQQSKRTHKKNAIIFIDEIDILGSKRGQVSSHMEYDQTLNQLLVEMDGMNTKGDTKVLVLAATNRIEALDSALLRPGRFDRIVKVDVPDYHGRLDILKIYMKKKPLKDDVSLEQLARETFGFSGAHLESLVNEGAILALRDGEQTISQSHFVEAIEKVILGEKAEGIPSTKEKERISVHEAGHALISEIVSPGSVANITITPRGGTLGYVRQNPVEEKYLQTEEELLSHIAIKLAGSMAEETLLGSKSTGAMQDIREAYKLSKILIQSGMSELGYVDPDTLPQSIWYEGMKEILETTQKRVQEVLKAYGSILEMLSRKLLDQEHVRGEELREILADNIECCHF